MRKIVAVVIVAPIAIVAGFVIGFGVAWRRNPRIGSGWLNRVANPALVRRGLSGSGKTEIATLEHFGRKSGTRHLTPIHPVPIEAGFRITVPLGMRSEWAKNVVAAGHCRMQLHDTVYDLDEPQLLPPHAMPELGAAAQLGGRAGMLYLRLHTFGEHEGALEPLAAETEMPPAEPLAVEPAPAAEPVSASTD
jgi:hypothetical protein